MMKCLTVLSIALGALPAVGFADSPLDLKSPGGNVRAQVQTGDRLTYTVEFNGQVVVEPSALGLIVNGEDLGQGAAVAGSVVTGEVNERYATRGVHATAVNHYRSMVVPMTGGPGKTAWELEVRAAADGVAYRYRVPGEGRRRIRGESSAWRLPAGAVLWHHSSDNRSYEARYEMDIVGQTPKSLRMMAPAAVKFPGGIGYGLVTEANLYHYSDMALYANGTNSFKAVFYDDPEGWDNEGEIVSPWRVTLLAADLNALVNSDLVRNLCPPPAPELANAAWIKPGRSIWHWLTGGAPKLEEQKSWIDGTRAMGYEYYLVDDGWRNWNGGGDNAWKAMEDLVNYAKSRDVAIWAWVDSRYVFKPAERETYFKRAKEMGIVGLKIDFPHPANSVWVQWYDDTLRDAARAGLMLDFHGAVKPTGRERTWPNEMTREGIAGREQGKSPSLHDITLPFLRYVQGHADFTPTLLIPKRLNGSSYAHELAMAVVFTSPYLCMGDHPSNYLKSPAGDVLKALPPVWDETRVLPCSEIGELAAFARRSGSSWFLGVINNLTPRRQTVTPDFLGEGSYKCVELADNPDQPDAFVRSERIVKRGDALTLPLRKDGGYVAWFIPASSK